MNFEPTDERRMLDDALRRLLSQHYDFAQRQRIAQSGEGHSMEMWRHLVDLGALGALFAEADGGLGGSGFDIALVFEALGGAMVLEPLLAALMAAAVLAEAKTDVQRALRRDIVAGSTLAVLAHADPEARYEASHVTTRARPTDGGWQLDGLKCVVRHAEQADFFIVSARSSGCGDDPTGISLFVLPAATPGITLRGYPLADGGRGADIALEGVHLPADALVGTEGQAFPTIEGALGAGVLALSAQALGAMESAKQLTLDYLRTRKQFGQSIGSNQALQHRMVDLWLGIEQARSAVINAANALQSADRVTRERALSAAKVTTGRVGTRVAEECIQMHGGIGMTWELPLSHLAKGLVLTNHMLGDEDHHLARYVALGCA
ncbi:alkylation response protein AidB-like acyl-CoA dehydrogenase [Variovorax sp. OAS795]|uniref:acyl-CoA dehydrogenase family protein n=1 Tax=Variovorax sp. OAS795 TaxID=3034231 RepID=UPI0033937E92